MSRKISRLGRAAAAGSAAVALAFTLSACSDDGGGKDDKSSSGEQGGSDSSDSSDSSDEQGKQPEQADDSKVIATLNGQAGMAFDVTSATRDSSGFVTVNGVLKNTSDSGFRHTSSWAGGDLELQKADGGGSLGAATLVDKKDNKRYYTLRDTEDAPLTTTGISSVDAGEKLRVFIQFPAPPKKSTEMDLQIPTFQSASLALTDS
ncbi:hypothetical protein E0L36_10580 [Streptomyces sp. AJS327]|uniref:hypothetical protein n=1 Tax=Streptomyces sp. AJS327 TaxID=2545265 RepID=UPI0015DEB625|nr:hypothetical protein [Streptomyces sp. AJS327]MBA0051320.1 hypothetical protein [Streptomyces sp. AJS327]